MENLSFVRSNILQMRQSFGTCINEQDIESATPEQYSALMKIANSYAARYIHVQGANSACLSSALYFPHIYGENSVCSDYYSKITTHLKKTPFEIHQELMGSIEATIGYAATCLSISHFLSHIATELDIANNVIVFNGDFDDPTRAGFHAALVFKYQGGFPTIDIAHKKHYVTLCGKSLPTPPYTSYMQHSYDYPVPFKKETTFLYDSSSFSQMNEPLKRVRLTDWPLETHGIFTQEKLNKFMNHPEFAKKSTVQSSLFSL